MSFSSVFLKWTTYFTAVFLFLKTKKTQNFNFESFLIYMSFKNLAGFFSVQHPYCFSASVS
jgi:hypothetical protein